MLDPIRHQLTNLLTAYGYNLYEGKNRARADDLLVREKAAEALNEAANSLRTLRTDYRRRFIPPATRENPDPPPERLTQLREMELLQTRLSDLSVQIRSMPVPTQDRVWERFRREQTLLNDLLRHDYNLIAPSSQLRDRIRELGPADWSESTGTELADEAARIERNTRARAELLRLPGW